jgi:glycosyltransferase involved in cell wall biosynthesis
MRVYQVVPRLIDHGIDARILDTTALPTRLRGRQFYRLIVLRQARQADVVVIQKRLFDAPTLIALKRANPRLVYDFDDAVFTGPGDPLGRPVAPAARRLQAVLRLARAVIAGNPTLADYASRYASCVTVVPTVVDVAAYRPKCSTATDGPPCIGWAGTANNLVSLEEIRPVLGEVTQRGLARFRIVSSRRPDWPEFDYDYEHWRAERAIEAIREFDIGVMPLADTPWNRGKCGFKTIEYMALGLPAVASPVGVLTEIVKDGKNGFLAASPEDWASILRRLAGNASLRVSAGLAGRATVERRYSLDSAVPKIAAVLSAVGG